MELKNQQNALVEAITEIDKRTLCDELNKRKKDEKKNIVCIDKNF